MRLEFYISKIRENYIRCEKERRCFNRYFMELKLSETDLKNKITQGFVDSLNAKIMDIILREKNNKYNFYIFSSYLFKMINEDYPDIIYKLSKVYESDTERYMYLIKKLQKKSFNTSYINNLNLLDIDELLDVYSERTIKDDIKKIFEFGFISNGILFHPELGESEENLKIYNKSLHPVTLKLNSQELFYLLKTLTDNPYQHNIIVLNKIYSQLSDNAREFINSHIDANRIKKINFNGNLDVNYSDDCKDINEKKCLIELLYKSRKEIGIKTNTIIYWGKITEINVDFFSIRGKVIRYDDIILIINI